MDWEPNKVYVDLTKKQIEESPPSDPSAPLTREYESQRHDFYGLPKYWE